MINKEQKKQYISEMTSQFENSEAVLVTHYQGLTMSQLNELRSQMREHGIQFKITRNRITKLALEKTKCKNLSNLFTGPTAVAFSKDAIMSARILSKFSKENKNLKLLGGIMGNDVLDQAGDKYGKIQEKMDPDAFAMGQFSKEMDDLLPIVIPLAGISMVVFYTIKLLFT